MVRSSHDVITDLKKLIYTEGYIYSLCLILFEDFHFDLNKIHEVDHKSRLSVKECSLIIGFLIKKTIDFSMPTSPEGVLALKERTYELMDELHQSLNEPQFAKIKEMLERRENGEKFEDTRESRLDFFVKAGGMVEPMFYSGDGVYDFQYLEYLEPKYKYDHDWLIKNKNFDITVTKEIVEKIKFTLRKKALKVNPINLKEKFPEIANKAFNKLKNKLTKEEIDEMERQQFTVATFYQYRQLFPPPKENGDSIEGWSKFYKNLLDLFLVTPSDLKGIRQDIIDSFFQNFSFAPVCNETYEGPGYFNILNSCPLIKFENDCYFVPINYLVAEAVYESPFYWMWDDKKYRNSLAKHRGDVGEEIAYKFLSKVFGTNNTFKSIIVETKKGQRDTDIDVLCILGNKALCVQVKSKKLTLTAKRGDFDQLSKDFKGAIQDAYNQGMVSREAILNKSARFFDEMGNELLLPSEIDEVYIMGLTTENYPSLVHQVYAMLDKKPQNPYPFVISAFDLELLVHYLADPYDFLYYVRQRIDLIEYFKAEEELVYLGYHLKQKLWRIDGYDGGMLDTDLGAIIDRNYYPYKTGVSHLLDESDDPIHNRWKDPKFDLFIEKIKHSNHPKVTDIIFHLLDWSGGSRKEIVERILNMKDISQSQGVTKSLATATHNFGFSYIVANANNLDELGNKVELYSKLRKYMTKCNAWLGVGAFSSSYNLIDFFTYNDEIWQPDLNLEEKYSEIIAEMKETPFTPMRNNKKVGRNERCPCNSGKKFKKCCGG